MADIDEQQLIVQTVNYTDRDNSNELTRNSGAAIEEEKMKKEFYGDKKNKSPEMDGAGLPPMSPGKKMLYYAGSPGRYIKK